MADWTPLEVLSDRSNALPQSMYRYTPPTPPTDDQTAMTHTGFKGLQVDPRAAAFGTGTLMGGTAGFAKYPLAASHYFNDSTPGTQTGGPQGLSWSDSLTKANKQVSDIREAAPGYYTAGNVAGGLLTIPATGGGGAVAQIGKQALYGGLSGYNENQDVNQGVVGAGIGAGAGILAKPIQSVQQEGSRFVNAVAANRSANIIRDLANTNDVESLLKINPIWGRDPRGIAAAAKDTADIITNSAKNNPEQLMNVMRNHPGVANGMQSMLENTAQQGPTLANQIAQGFTSVAAQHPMGTAGFVLGGLAGAGTPHEHWYDTALDAAVGAGAGELAGKGATMLAGRPALVNAATATVPGLVAGGTAAAVPYASGSKLTDILTELRNYGKPQAPTPSASEWQPIEVSGNAAPAPAASASAAWQPMEVR